MTAAARAEISARMAALNYLQELLDRQSRPTPQGAAARVELPLVECVPWCDEGDGHPDCYGLSDQACWEPSERVELTLEDPDEDGYMPSLAVMARRRPKEAGHVLLHMDGMQVSGPIPQPWKTLDHTVMLTRDEAERLGRRLLASAKLARSAHPTGS